MSFSVYRPLTVFVGIVSLVWACSGALAQGGPRPTPTVFAEAPRQQIVVGYSYLKIGGSQVNNLPIGFLLDSNFFFTRHLGLQIESASHWGSNGSVGTVEAGPVLRFPTGRWAPFVHANIGFARVSPPGANKFGWGMSGGGGLDVRLSRVFEIRLFQADYVYNGIALNPPLPQIDQNAIRLSGGAIWDIGRLSPPTGPPSFKCYAEPDEVYAGEPVQITGTPIDFSPKRKVDYTWTATGGRAEGNAANTSVDTNGLRPGTYAVIGNASDGKASARCSAQFSVRPFPPPIVRCSVNPATVPAGGTVAVTAEASSNSNHPLSYSYRASGGSISGAGATATLATAGASPGAITITATVTDDQGQSASCDATVMVGAPIPTSTLRPSVTPASITPASATPATATSTANQAAPIKPTATPTPAPVFRRIPASSTRRLPHPMANPVAVKVSDLEFHPGKRLGVESRVDNVAKAILDDLALRLRSDPDLRAVIVGMAAADEPDRTAAQRAVNVKLYLKRDAGIDPHRVEVRAGAKSGMKAEIWIVPAGAAFDQTGTQPVDEQKIKGVPRAF